MKELPRFENEPQRRKWFTDNADYFTAVQFINRRYQRGEYKTLVEAEAAGRILAKEHPKPVMIYAVVGCYDNFVRIIVDE